MTRGRNVANMAETAAEANENEDSFMNTELGGKIQSMIQIGITLSQFVFGALSLLEGSSWIVDTGPSDNGKGGQQIIHLRFNLLQTRPFVTLHKFYQLIPHQFQHLFTVC
ncbi:uncharacterized protein LOC110818769 isoform X4 [Carica papaya]|uniref:uncharacterized protein LOC110818769 isoform X4 n=1 Tax=Carica papaya TaxID=3649 RepID=UPI000B8C9103|nr:uncharacterized protein LOC110818769 isoform X4 [Carica papaya]